MTVPSKVSGQQLSGSHASGAGVSIGHFPSGAQSGGGVTTGVEKFYVRRAMTVQALRTVCVSAAGTSTYTVEVCKNGTEDATVKTTHTNPGAGDAQTSSGTLSLAAGDYITMSIKRTAGAQNTVVLWSFELVPT